MNNNTNKVIAGILGLLVLGVGGYYTYKYFSYTPEEKARAATASLIEHVSRHMILPVGEVPTIFEIKDPETLARQQQFFSSAQKGDELLIYPKASKAIIYSPSKDIIVNVGPVTNDGSTTTTKNK